VRAAAKLIRNAEDEMPDAIEELKELYPHTGKAYIIGITGSPGSGKSTLVDMLISSFRQRNETVGVIAIDPSSPFTGGAILGDRIRMQRHSLDEGVFIRSLASRGWHGGLSKAANNVIHIMDAMGKSVILVETVGVGQGEVDIINSAHTSAVILVPGMGDGIQTIKAGILEIANIFIINKADRPGVGELEAELNTMVHMSNHPQGSWKPEVVLTEAVNNKGIEELTEKIYQHRQFLISSGMYDKHLRKKARLELAAVLRDSMTDYFFQKMSGDDNLQKVMDDLVNKNTDPYSAASEIIKKLTGEGNP
jgi:LAO/AO transport system kinase